MRAWDDAAFAPSASGLAIVRTLAAVLEDALAAQLDEEMRRQRLASMSDQSAMARARVR